MLTNVGLESSPWWSNCKLWTPLPICCLKYDRHPLLFYFQTAAFHSTVHSKVSLQTLQAVHVNGLQQNWRDNPPLSDSVTKFPATLSHVFGHLVTGREVFSSGRAATMFLTMWLGSALWQSRDSGSMKPFRTSFTRDPLKKLRIDWLLWTFHLISLPWWSWQLRSTAICRSRSNFTGPLSMTRGHIMTFAFPLSQAAPQPSSLLETPWVPQDEPMQLGRTRLTTRGIMPLLWGHRELPSSLPNKRPHHVLWCWWCPSSPWRTPCPICLQWFWCHHELLELKFWTQIWQPNFHSRLCLSHVKLESWTDSC